MIFFFVRPLAPMFPEKNRVNTAVSQQEAFFNTYKGMSPFPTNIFLVLIKLTTGILSISNWFFFFSPYQYNLLWKGSCNAILASHPCHNSPSLTRIVETPQNQNVSKINVAKCWIYESEHSNSNISHKKIFHTTN